jgi:dihydrolipoamide dehydrogenase
VHTVELTGADGAVSQVKAKNLILATGSAAKMMPGLTADDRILTNIEILAIGQVPKSLVVIGAGAVGVEFASIFRSFGTEVTILEFLPRMVPVEDDEISKELTRLFKKRGIDVNTGAKVEMVEKTADGVKVTYTDANGKAQVKEAEKVLVAVGRLPLTENVGLEKTKIELERGFVKVNEAQETAEPGIFAIGDIVAGLPQLAHVGAMSGMVAVAKIAGREYWPVQRDRIPSCTYTEPQIGSAGLTEAQAKERGFEVKVGKFPFAGNSKATIVDSHDGFVKIVSDAKYGEILGVHIIGPQATELIAEAVAVMALEGTVEQMMFTIHAHPTLSESLLDAYGAVDGMAINA